MTISNQSRTPAALRTRRNVWAGIFLFALSNLIVLPFPLLLGPYPTSQSELVAIYLFYCVVILAALHGSFFAWDSEARIGDTRRISRNMPRYLDYAYSCLVSLGLLQILFMSGQFSHFISAFHGDEGSLVKKIVSQATTHANERCRKPDKFFTIEYCEKLNSIVTAKEPSLFIVANVLNDDEFLKHEVAPEEMRISNGNPVFLRVTSPIWKYADALKAELEHKRGGGESQLKDAAVWIALLLLPIGIGLRILKTSLELYADLE